MITWLGVQKERIVTCVSISSCSSAITRLTRANISLVLCMWWTHLGTNRPCQPGTGTGDGTGGTAVTSRCQHFRIAKTIKTQLFHIVFRIVCPWIRFFLLFVFPQKAWNSGCIWPCGPQYAWLRLRIHRVCKHRGAWWKCGSLWRYCWCYDSPTGMLSFPEYFLCYLDSVVTKVAIYRTVWVLTSCTFWVSSAFLLKHKVITKWITFSFARFQCIFFDPASRLTSLTPAHVARLWNS